MERILQPFNQHVLSKDFLEYFEDLQGILKDQKKDSNKDDAFLESVKQLFHRLENQLPLDQFHPSIEMADYFLETFPYFQTENEKKGDEFTPIFQLLEEYRDQHQQIDKDYAPVLSFLLLSIRNMSESALLTSFRDKLVFYPDEQQCHFLNMRPFFAPSSKVFVKKLGDEKIKKAQEINDFIFNNSIEIIHLPLLFDYVLSKASKVTELITIALDIRDKPATKAYRDWCSECDNYLQNGEQEKALKLIHSANKYIQKISQITNIQTKIQIQLSYPPAIIFDLPPNIFSRQNHLVFLKQIYSGTYSPILQNNRIRKVFKNLL